MVSLRKPISLVKAANLNERNRSEARQLKDGADWFYGPMPTIDYRHPDRLYVWERELLRGDDNYDGVAISAHYRASDYYDVYDGDGGGLIYEPWEDIDV